MTVYLAHAAADRALAEGLEVVLERRGHFVELDEGEAALAPVAANDVVVTLVSRALGASAARLRLIQRALDAWSGDRLVLVALDETSPPIGLRDLPAIEARVAETRDLIWVDVATAIQHKLGAAAPRLVAPRKKPRRNFGLGVVRVLLTLALLAPGIFAAAATASIWLANRIGPRPGGVGELRAGIDAFGAFYGVPSGLTEWMFLGAMALMFGVLGRFGARLLAKPAPVGPPPREADKAGVGVFVIAAPADAARVRTAIDGASSKNGPVLGFGAPDGDNAAAIGAAARVLVMCSRAAFDSDQVKRELYLAERSGRRVIPVFLDAVTPAEDFAYFFGAPAVDIHSLAGPERADALVRALGGV